MWPLYQPLPKQGGQGVVALLEQRGHVVDLVADPLAIVGPVGGQHVVAHALAVDAHLVEPQRRCIQPGRSNRLAAQGKRLAEDGNRPGRRAARRPCCHTP